MSDDKKPDTEEAILERARKRAEGRAKLESEQRLKDLLAKESLDEEHDGAIATVTVTKFKPGFPTFAIVRTPRAEHYKRYKDQIGKGAKKDSANSAIEAVDLLGKSCWVYPAPNDDASTSDAQKAMLAEFPGIITTLGNAAVALADGKVASEGKG